MRCGVLDGGYWRWRRGLVGGETAEKVDGVFVGADGRRAEAGQVHGELGDGPAPPADRQVGSVLVWADGGYDFFDQACGAALCVRSVVVGADHTRPMAGCDAD